MPPSTFETQSKVPDFRPIFRLLSHDDIEFLNRSGLRGETNFLKWSLYWPSGEETKKMFSFFFFGPLSWRQNNPEENVIRPIFNVLFGCHTLLWSGDANTKKKIFLLLWMTILATGSFLKTIKIISFDSPWKGFLFL